MSERGETMTAAVYHGRRDVRIEERPIPGVGPGEVLLAVAVAGICGTDVSEYRNGRNPVQADGGSPVGLGHEFGGYVVEKADDVDLELGTLVACGAGVSCGHCRQCLAGRTNLCESYFTAGFQRDGGLAEYCAVPARICVDADAAGADAWMAGMAQPVAIAVHAFRRGEVSIGDRVAVIGAGGVGAFLVYAAARAGAEVDVLDVDPERLELAGRLGAAQQIRIDQLDRDWAAEAAYACVYEASGRDSALATGVAMASPGGKLVLVGVQAAGVTLEPRTITLKEITAIGTCAHTVDADLSEALALLASREGGWRDIAPRALPLSELIPAGLDRSSPGPVKSLFAPWSNGPIEAPTPLVDRDGKVAIA